MDGGGVTLAGILAIFVFVGWVIAIYVSLVGVVWSPVGALVGTFIARRRGMSVLRAALLSALYSILSPFLWLHIALRIWVKRIASVCLCFAYFNAFFAWIVSMLTMWIDEFVIGPSYRNETDNDAAFGTPGVAVVAMLLIGALAWIVSLSRMVSMSHDTNAPVFLPPFFFAAVWAAGLAVNLTYLSTRESLEWLNWWLALPTTGALLWIFWPSGPWIPQRVRAFFRGDFL